MITDTLRRQKLSAQASLLLILYCGLAQAEPVSRLTSKIDEYLQASVKHDQFSGSVLVAKEGKPLFSNAYGMANYELGVANTPQTTYAIASLTKQFTAMAILQLQERKQLKISDPICRYLDDCPEAWQPITIHHLLTHSSGIKNYSSLPEWDDQISRLPYERQAFVNVFRDLPLSFTPGEKYAYSNSGYYLLGLIIEQVSGVSYADFLRENIFIPLAMSNSGYYDPPTLIANRATGYYWASGGFVNAPILNQSLTFSGGGIHSTTQDLLRWDQALYSEKLVSQQSLKAMFTPFLSDYAYGWKIASMHGKKMAGHSGSYNGFSSFIARYADERVVVIVLSNSDRTSAAKVAIDVSAIVFDAPYTLPKPQVADVLAQALAEKGVDVAVKKVREIIYSHTEHYNFKHQEKVINDLGYALLERKKFADAIKVFALNVELAPDSGNAYDSLAEAYMVNGDKPLAIAHYQKSLQLDPDNQNAVKMLRVLQSK